MYKTISNIVYIKPNLIWYWSNVCFCWLLSDWNLLYLFIGNLPISWAQANPFLAMNLHGVYFGGYTWSTWNRDIEMNISCDL